jgi:hypothetical protein
VTGILLPRVGSQLFAGIEVRRNSIREAAMREIITALVLTVVALTVFAGPAAAQVPEKMNYQVMLTDDVDEPLSDQAVTLVFRIYDAEAGGTLKWSETHNATTNSIGVVSVVLGSIGSMHSPDFVDPMWLEVEADGQVLAPRREFVSAPYAFYSADSDGLGGLDADDYTTDLELSVPGTINDGGNPVDWTNLKNVPSGFADGADAEGGAGDGHSLDAVDGSPIDALYVDEDGDVHVGGGSSDGRLELHPTGSQTNHFAVSTSDYGGQAYFNDETGTIHTSIEPDVAGTGGFFEVANGLGGGAFYVDGNHLGGGDGAVVIQGAGSTTTFDTAQSGDDAVSLPVEAVASPEILDEPGVASNANTTPVILTGPTETLLSRSIWAPAAGYVLAMATAEVEADHTPTVLSGCHFGVSDNNTTFMTAGAIYCRLPSDAAAGVWTQAVSVQMLFEVGSPGWHTFYFLGDELLGDWQVNDRALTLVYFPTAYGSIGQTVAAPPENPEERSAAVGHAMTPADIAAERDASVAANNARIEVELAAMEAKIAEFRASMGNGNKQ